jgi:hypothetical protein
MHLFIAREAVDKHLEVAGPLIDPKLSLWQKLKLLPRVAAFYALWYPKQWLPRSFTAREDEDLGPLAAHARYAARASRRLARSIFHGMLRFGPKLERKQAFLFRAVDVALELFALSAALLRANGERGHNPSSLALAESFAHAARRRIDDRLRDMWSNDDVEQDRLASELLDGRFTWLELGTMGVPYSASELEPEKMETFFAAREQTRERRESDTRALLTKESGDHPKEAAGSSRR